MYLLSRNATIHASVHSWSANIADAWNRTPAIYPSAISLTVLENGSLGIKRSPVFWYFFISLNAATIVQSIR